MTRTSLRCSAVFFGVLAAGTRAQDDVVVVCHERPGLTVSLRCRAVATPADRDWLQLEFDNQTDGPLSLASCSWRLDQAEVSDAAGKPLRHSSLASGSDHDLFPRSGPPWPVPLPPGVTRAAIPVSDYATALLGVPDEEWRVSARVAVLVALDDEMLVNRGEEGLPFSFRWLPPDEDGVARMRATLATLLRDERPAIGSLYLVGTLLGHDEVGGAWQLEELLALPRPARSDEPFHPWNCVLRHLDQRFAADPRLSDWALARLREDDAAIRDELQRMAHLWRQDFLPELMRDWPSEPKANEVLPTRAMHVVPWLLEQRGAPHRGDAAVCAALAAPWARVLGDLTPAALESMPKELRAARRRQVADALSGLGMSRDRRQLDRLGPWLACHVALHDGSILGRQPMIPPEHERVGDVACDAVLRVLGEDLAADFMRHRGEAADGTGTMLLPGHDSIVRNRQIAALEERLRRMR
ncbi:MAG: hypothetical protein HZB39_16220 [Planctomycetes bacterium]|nr:hypothetical protein [Planctomycetota bacterium]